VGKKIIGGYFVFWQSEFVPNQEKYFTRSKTEKEVLGCIKFGLANPDWKCSRLDSAVLVAFLFFPLDGNEKKRSALLHLA